MQPSTIKQTIENEGDAYLSDCPLGPDSNLNAKSMSRPMNLQTTEKRPLANLNARPAHGLAPVGSLENQRDSYLSANLIIPAWNAEPAENKGDAYLNANRWAGAMNHHFQPLACRGVGFRSLETDAPVRSSPLVRRSPEALAEGEGGWKTPANPEDAA